jgi:hypothetical protein
MPTPPRPDWITAVANLVLSPKGGPVAAPDRLATGRLGPSSMVIPCLSSRGREQSSDAAQSLFDGTQLLRCHRAP